MNQHIFFLFLGIEIITSLGDTLPWEKNELDSRISILINELEAQRCDSILFWNLVTIHAGANDYNTGIASKPDQPGPTAGSRAYAIVHGAMYDAMLLVNPISNRILVPNDIFWVENSTDTTSVDSAIMQAAYRTLTVLYPKQSRLFKAARRLHLDRLRHERLNEFKIQAGIYYGHIVATYILEQRRHDGSKITENYRPKNVPGYHQEDPTHPGQGFLGVSWGKVKPFVLDDASKFLESNIVGETVKSRQVFINSLQYVKDYQEVYEYGSKTSIVRTADQTEIGIFWGYDGAPKIGVPPRLYNQIVRTICIKQKNSLEENGRLFALVNYALADAGIACWKAKYYYDLWRPIVAIRTGSNETYADPDWTPLGAPADGAGENFTPPFPSYVSGHSTFGSACFEMLRLFYGTDGINFEFQSDEYNGITIDSNTGFARPAKTRKYDSFSQAEMENYLSRIYLGVHWRIDQEEGRIMGRKVAQYIYNTCN